MRKYTLADGKKRGSVDLCDNGEYLDHCVSIGSPLVYTATALRLEDNIAAVFCRNGHLFSLPCNRRVGERIICGVFYVVRVKDGKLQSLADTDVVKYSLDYWESEKFDDEEIADSWLR